MNGSIFLDVVCALAITKKSGLSTRPDSLFESAVEYEQIDKQIIYFKKRVEANLNFKMALSIMVVFPFTQN